MSFYDLIAMSLGNLWRRKLRTLLTVLGVLIGTASVVAMISLALGMKQQLMQEFSGMGSATQIRVRSSGEVSSSTDTDAMLTDSNLSMFEEMEYVKRVAPSLSFDANLEQGKYSGYATLMGVGQDVLDSQTLEKGEIPSKGSSGLQVLAGNTVLTNFGYAIGEEYYNYYTTGELPDIDLMRQIKQVRVYDYSSSEEEAAAGTAEDTGEDAGDGGDEIQDAGSGLEPVIDDGIYFRINITGILDGGPDSYKENSDNLLVNIDSLKKYLIRTFGRDKIPGQPKNNGKPMKDWVYNMFLVEVDESAHVEEVMQNIQDMGFQADSNKELLDSIQQSLQIVELTLGGIGMVAFLVAAIGIANTMMMSTYERTKEIGVMKVLGCDMRDIRKLFLMEAACIGLIGGVVGLGFTFILSAVINSLARTAEGMNGNISVITWWLALVAVAFSTMMGMLAGYFPARRAMKLSPLAAIRTE